MTLTDSVVEHTDSVVEHTDSVTLTDRVLSAGGDLLSRRSVDGQRALHRPKPAERQLVRPIAVYALCTVTVRPVNALAASNATVTVDRLDSEHLSGC